MPITRSILKSAPEETQLKGIKAIYIASKDGRTKSKIDLTALAKVVDATLANKGLVQLQTEINDNETNAATPKAVNTVKAIADANAQKIKEVENSINSALPGEGTLADKLRNVAFSTKDNQFTESQTINAKDHSGNDVAAVSFKSSKLTHETGAFDPGTTSVSAGSSLQDKNGKAVAVQNFSVTDAGRAATLGVVDANNQEQGIKVQINKAAETSSVVAFAPATPDAAVGQEIATAKFVADKLKTVQDSLKPATAEKLGVVKLTDEANDGLDAATGGTAVSPKALHATEQKVKSLTDVVGTTAEHAALKNAANEFSESQTIVLKKSDTTESGAFNLKAGEYKHLDGTFAAGATKTEAGVNVTDNTGAVVGGLNVVAEAGKTSAAVAVKTADGTASGEVKVEYDRASGKFVATAPSTADEANGAEIATADFVTKKMQGVQDTLVDATDKQRGLTLLSDAVDSDAAAADGKTAATPKAVKTVKTALDAVTAKVGANAENAALKNAANIFTEDNAFAKGLTLSSYAQGHAHDGSGDQVAKFIIKNTATDVASHTIEGESALSGIAFTDKNDAESAALKSIWQLGQGSPTISLGLAGDGSTLKPGALELKHDATGEVVAYVPATPATAKGNEVATAKFVTDKVGDLDPTHVAYTNKTNVFTTSQTIKNKAASDGQPLNGDLVFSTSEYDASAGSFEGGATNTTSTVKLTDKNNVNVASLEVSASNTAHKASLAVSNSDGSDAKSLDIKWDRTSSKFVASAPSTANDATGTEIATADFVVGKTAKTDAALKRVTDVIGADAENAALVNKANTFTEPQKIQSDGKTLNFGGTGVESSGAADDALVLGAGFDGTKAELIIAANGSITRTELPADPDDFEVATVGYVKSLGDIGSSMSQGNWTIAMSDFTKEAFQASMDEGVFYSVPFNAADQYIQIDPETGKPAETQADGVTDKKVDHFVIMYKAPTSKLVMNLGERKIAPNFEDVPLLSADNNFAGTNTFKDAQKATPSVDPELGDVNDKSYIAKSELIAYFNKHSPWSNVVTAEPAVEDMTPGQLYFVVEA